MTDHKFTDDEIIKALECCRTIDGNDCKNCAYHGKIYEIGHGGCTNDLMGDALALINRQKAEIERLQADINSTCVFLKAQRKESEREHKTQMEMLNQIKEQIPLALERAKAEAIKEFAERLKEKYYGRYECSHVYIRSIIDTLVKEMTEALK